MNDDLRNRSEKLRKIFGIALCYGTLILIALLHAAEYLFFVIGNGFAPAGLNGIVTMIQYKFGFSIGYMSLIINIPLCVFAFFFLNRQFATRTLIYCLSFSLFYEMLKHAGLERFQYNAGGHDTVFPVLISGVISGFVYSICFRRGGSTGGTDIVSKFVGKKKPQWNFFWVTFTINAFVAAASFFVYATYDESGALIYDYKPVALCILYCFVSSFIGNYIIKGTKRACKFTVITSHAQEIANDVLGTLRHSATIVPAVGAFSHSDKDLLICVVNQHQIIDFMKILSNYDNTFSFSETVNETYGNFKKIR